MAGGISEAPASEATAPAKRWGKDYFPNSQVVTQNGDKLSFYDDVVHDRMVVFSFIYTSCRDICPLVTARLAQVREKMSAEARRKIKFVSITIDPEHDGPAELKAHAEAFNTDPDWLFLSGKPSDIRLINHKLGERSRALGEHRNEIVLGNDLNGTWARDSAFTDLNVLTATIQSMDATLRSPEASGSGATAAVVGDELLPGQALFAKACAGCHTVGNGQRVGPDLAGVTRRRERAWLTRYIMDPYRMRAEDDPIARELASRYKAVRMPKLELSNDDASDVLAYLEAMTYKVNAELAGAAASAHAGHHHHQH
jgi:protein SCO1